MPQHTNSNNYNFSYSVITVNQEDAGVAYKQWKVLQWQCRKAPFTGTRSLHLQL